MHSSARACNVYIRIIMKFNRSELGGEQGNVCLETGARVGLQIVKSQLTSAPVGVVRRCPRTDRYRDLSASDQLGQANETAGGDTGQAMWWCLSAAACRARTRMGATQTARQPVRIRPRLLIWWPHQIPTWAEEYAALDAHMDPPCQILTYAKGYAASDSHMSREICRCQRSRPAPVEVFARLRHGYSANRGANACHNQASQFVPQPLRR